jgi:leader peptidase (prepilin peptidase)/N-methyltransferase
MTAVSGLLPGWLLVGTSAVLGLLIGSFLNVVIHRVPAGLSLVSPGSACPACASPVRGYDNVPVVSWLVLRGRCRDCGTPISSRYPLVELATAALFALAAWQFGWSVFTLAVAVLAASGVALFMIDLDHRRLPFSITGVSAGAIVVVLAVDGALHGWGPAPTALLSGLVWTGVYGGVWLATSGRGMGLGDVALAPVLGTVLGWLGWGPSLVGLLGGFVIGAAVGVVLLATGRAGKRSRVPHGPFLLTGAAVGLFAGGWVWEAYLGLFGLTG